MVWTSRQAVVMAEAAAAHVHLITNQIAHTQKIPTSLRHARASTRVDAVMAAATKHVS